MVRFVFNDWIRTAFVGGLVYAAEKQVDQSIYEIGKFHIDTFFFLFI